MDICLIRHSPIYYITKPIIFAKIYIIFILATLSLGTK